MMKHHPHLLVSRMMAISLALIVLQVRIMMMLVCLHKGGSSFWYRYYNWDGVYVTMCTVIAYNCSSIFIAVDGSKSEQELFWVLALEILHYEL